MTEYVLDLSSIYSLRSLNIPTWAILSLQDSASPLIEELSFFHDFTITIITIITLLVGLNIVFICLNKLIDRNLLQEQTIETMWTILPVFVLIIIALPSLKLLYILDDPFTPKITIKTIGHQWYWSYEYSDFPNIEFDSYIKPQQDNILSEARLLESDNRVILPINNQIRIIVSATDVIHSWTVPALGVKIDAVPGRLNQISFIANRPGIFYGQCSEICGANHRFIPIKLEIISTKDFLKWVSTKSSNGWKKRKSFKLIIGTPLGEVSLVKK